MLCLFPFSMLASFENKMVFVLLGTFGYPVMDRQDGNPVRMKLSCLFQLNR